MYLVKVTELFKNWI